MWPAIALGAMFLALVATVVAVIALVAATSRSSGSSPAPATAAPTYSAAEVSAAHRKLCDAYKLAAHAVQIETNGTSPERAGIAEVNGALLLQDAVDSAPAIAPSDRAAALALAGTYKNIAAVASLNDLSIWRPALDDANAKDAAMNKLCGTG
ncbi:hypothetical protein [Mycobacterium colombiense]|nr:hypothetical protein [Mycobacterium colombiense]